MKNYQNYFLHQKSIHHLELLQSLHTIFQVRALLARKEEKRVIFIIVQFKIVYNIFSVESVKHSEATKYQ